MVQWIEKPAARPQVSPPEQDEPEVAHRPLRRTRRSRIAGPLQIMSVCALFGLIVGSYFVFKETTAGWSAGSRQKIAQERDPSSGRIVIMDRTQCRELGFDNQSGRTVQKGQVSCHDVPAYDGSNPQSLYRHPANRLEAIRRSFGQ